MINCVSAFTILAAAIQKAGYTDSVSIGMDVAASKFSKDGLYDGNYKNLTSSKDALVSFWLLCVEKRHNALGLN